MDSTIENVEQVASDELDKAKARFIGGRSIDRGDPEDDERFVHSDDEGMIEEIVTTVEEDKDLECKVKKKIETKKTIAEDPETHNKITKVVKTEVTEITRTITINDENDLERAKRELGIDDVKKFLPSNCHFQSSTSWIDQPRLTRIQEKFYDPSNEIVTSKDFPSDSPVKQNSPQPENPSNDFLKSEQSLAEATTVGRGAVVETISSDEIVAAGSNSSGPTTKNVEKKKKSRLNLCSCTRSQTTDHDEEKRKQKIIEKKSKEKKKASIGNANLIQPAHDEAVRTVIDDEKSVPLTKENEMAVEQIDETLPIYNEEQLNKILGEISQDKPLTLAEAIAYDYIDLEDPKLALQSETIRSIKNLFRPASIDEEKNFNLIRVKRSGEIFTDFNLAETNSFEKFSKTEPLIYQLQQSFEPTLDFTEKQFRSLAEIVRNHRKEYSDLQFDIGRTLIPSGDLKESSTNDFSQSDSGYSMTTTTQESLASKVKTEFATITEPSENQQQLENDEKTDEEDQRTVNHLESRSTTLDSNEIHPETVVQSTPETPKQIEVPSVTIAEPAACEVTLVTQTIEILPPPPPLVQTEVEVSPAPAVEPAACQVITVTKTLEIVPRPEDVEVEVSAPPAACEIITVIEPIRIEHLEPRPATIEPIHVESEPTPIVIPKEKHEESVVSKALENLHGASVDLPQVELVTPGPLPTLNIAKEKKEKPTKKPKEKAIKTKKSSVGLCASCFGAKAAEKKKKDATNAPIEQKKEVEEVAAATATPVEINETTPPAVVQDEIPLVSPAPIEEVSLVSSAPIEEVSRVTSALVEQVPLISATPVEEIALVTPAPVEEEQLVAPAPIEESPKVEETHKIEEIVHELPKLEDRLDATIEKLVVTEEPHYQLPSSEPVPPVVIENDYSLPDTNDYDIPRSFESPKVEEITLPKDVEVSTVEPMESKEINEISTLVASSSSPPQIESIMLNNGDDTMPNVDVKEKSSKGSYKLAKKKKEKVPKEKKPNFFTSIFRSSDRKSKTPALDLPAVERDLNVPGETPVLNIASSKSNEKIDPLHVPHVDLPQPDVQLPSFDRPEAKLIEEKPVELTVPAVELPPIADLDLPKDEKKPVEISPIELVQIPVVELPEIQYKNDENQPFVLPEIHLKTSKDPEVAVLPTVENGLALASPVNDLLDIQVNHSEFPVETDYTKTAIVNDTQHVVESSTPVKIVLPTVEESKKIEKKKTSSALCSCFGSKSTPRAPIVAPKSELPQIEMPLPSSNISSTLKTKNSLRAPTTELPAVEFNEKPSVVPQIDSIQSRSDSGLEQIVSSHMTTTSDELQQNPSISSGLGTEIKRENSFSRHDFAKKITLTDESRTKFIFRQDELKKCLENEISNSIEEFDAKKDEKILKKILSHAIDLIKDKKVSTYPELKQKLIVEHKNEAFIVDPVVRAFYCTLEKQGLDNIDKPEFPLAIRDMVRLPAQQTFDTVTQLNKTSEKSVSTPKKSSSWLCGRSKTSSNVVATPKTNVDVGLLDERRRLQLNAHRQELGTILRDRIHSTSTPIRHFNENPKDVEKILRKTLTSVTQPKILSYEQIRNDFKGEFKQTFFLVDPIVDVVRDTFDHCDITQMNEKTNLDILDANIAQTAQLYNQVAEQNHLLNGEELENLRSNRLNWLNAHLLQREPKTKSKQNKELTKILQRATNILSLNLLYTWDDINGQLRREFVKTPDLCDRSVELIKKGQKDGLFLLNQSPEAEQDVTTINIIQPNGKRRASSLITDRAKQNLKTNRNQIVKSITTLLYEHHKPLYTENQIQTYLNKTFQHLEGQKSGQFSTYNDLKLKLKKDFKSNHENLLEQIVDVIEQAHAVNQFDDIEKSEVQTLMKDRLDGKPLVIKEMFVSLPPRVGNFANSKHSNDDPSRNLSTSINGDRTLNSSTSSHRVARGLSWREANERARILFYRGKHPAIHYDEQAAGFDVRMLLETNAGGTQEIPVTDSDVHELLNSCGVQWDGVNIISLVDHSEDVVRAAEQAALKVIREKGLVDLRTPPTTRNQDEKDEPSTNA